MLNHARTLLLNAPPAPSDAYPAEEFVPLGFKTLALPSYLTTIRATLFGAQPDRLMLNYRTRQLLGVTATTELQSYLTALDSRLTYDLQDEALFRHPFVLTANQISGDDITVYFGGIAGTSPDVTGLCRHEWRIVFGSAISATVRRRTRPILETVHSFEIVDGLSTPISLDGTAFHFRFHPLEGVVDWETLSHDEWAALGEGGWETMTEEDEGEEFLENPVLNVRADVRPERNPAQLLAQLDSLGEPTLLELFAVGSALGETEPYATCRRLWTDGREPHYRLAAAVTAMIYQTERARVGDG